MVVKWLGLQAQSRQKWLWAGCLHARIWHQVVYNLMLAKSSLWWLLLSWQKLMAADQTTVFVTNTSPVGCLQPDISSRHLHQLRYIFVCLCQMNKVHKMVLCCMSGGLWSWNEGCWILCPVSERFVSCTVAADRLRAHGRRRAVISVHWDAVCQVHTGRPTGGYPAVSAAAEADVWRRHDRCCVTPAQLQLCVCLA